LQDDRVTAALILEAQVAHHLSLNQQVRSDVIRRIKNAERRVQNSGCIICWITGDYPRPLDLTLVQHHPAGKIRNVPNYPDTITVCGHCHQFLSDHQETWRACGRSLRTRLSSYLFGWADIFELFYNKSGEKYCEALARKFRAQGSYIRHSRQKF
jgi:hypothetical protein